MTTVQGRGLTVHTSRKRSAARMNESAQNRALERLVTLLENEAVAHTEEPVRTVRRGDRVSQRARLRKAHAQYALTSMEDMVRVGDGAWLRRRYN